MDVCYAVAILTKTLWGAERRVGRCATSYEQPNPVQYSAAYPNGPWEMLQQDRVADAIKFRTKIQQAISVIFWQSAALYRRRTSPAGCSKAVSVEWYRL